MNRKAFERVSNGALYFSFTDMTLMSNDRIQLSIVIDTRQIAVMLHGDKRVSLESRRGKRIVIAAEFSSVEYCCVTVKKLLNNVEIMWTYHCRWTIKDQKLLDGLGIS